MNVKIEKNSKASTRVEEDDELDMIQLAKILWKGRFSVFYTTIIFMAIGLLIALFSPKEYEASTTMMLQSNEGNKLGGGLGGFAAMAGINLGAAGGNSTVVPPTLYPQILKSIPFQKEMMKTFLTIEGHDTPVSFADYYLKFATPSVLGTIKKYTIGLPGVIIKAVKGKQKDSGAENEIYSGVITVSKTEKKLIEKLSVQLSLENNKKDGYISLTARMPEALPAAQLVKRAQELLQNYIIEFKSQKAKEQLIFIQERYAEKQKEFEKIQKKLAQFRDRNRNVSTAMAQAELESLQSEYGLVYGVCSELAKQVETQRIQVKEDTPVFTILEPVFVPIVKSKPRRVFILVIWTFLGGIVGAGMVFGRKFIAEVKHKWGNK
jgi:uncharacterized protein involved in exopolysaccharide biosynthesis